MSLPCLWVAIIKQREEDRQKDAIVVVVVELLRLLLMSRLSPANNIISQVYLTAQMDA